MDKHTLSELIKMAEFSYEHSKRVGAHQEFLSEDREVLSKAKRYLNEISDGKESSGELGDCNMPRVSGSASVNKCVDCGIENDTVRIRPDGYGMQCYKCYKSDMDFEADYN
jgi:hypothetical protein